MEVTEILRADFDAPVKVVTAEPTITGAESHNDEEGASYLTAENLRGMTFHSDKEHKTDLPSKVANETNGLEEGEAARRHFAAGLPAFPPREDII